jgi:hypothetical protein
LSIKGCSVKKIPKNLSQNMKELQENSALYVLSRFCDRNYKKTIKNLANHEIFLNQIKGNFTILSNMVHQK